MADTKDKPKPEPSRDRQRYEPPALVEYGDIATLTQTGGASIMDGGGGRKQL